MEANFETAVLLPLPAVKAMNGGDEPVRTCLTMLSQLEASLHGSRKALLARDLAGVEQETREQRVLAGKIKAILQQRIAPLGSGLEEDLKQSGKRVLAAGRLQADRKSVV